MNAARLGVNLLPTITRLIGSEPGEDRFDDMTKFSVDLDNQLKSKISTFKEVYKQGFEMAKGREPNSGADLVAYIAQDYPYAAPIYTALNKIGLPAAYAIPLSVGISSGIAFDPKTDESSLFFDSAAIQGLKTYFNALPGTPEGEVFDRAYQTFEGTGLAAFVGPIINTALFLKKNVPAFNKAIPGAAVATGSATAIGELTDQTILNPQEQIIPQTTDGLNQDQSLMDTIKGGVDQFGNKLTEIGGAIKKEFSGEAMANPLISKGVNQLTPKLAPIFKSAVIDAVEKIPNKAPGNQILGTIKNIQGVTQQEMKWIGLDDFLKDKPSVTKQEVSDFIQANRLDVNEVMLPRQTSTKKTDEELKSWFKDQNGDYGENAYYAYQDIQYALADNGGVRFDDFAYKIKKGTQQYTYNTRDFMNHAGLWDEFYETNEQLSYNFFKTELQNTFKITDIISKNKDLDTAGSFEQLMTSFLKEENTFRQYHNTSELNAMEFKNLLFSKDDLATLKNYLKALEPDGYKVKTEEIFIDDANLKKLHNEYKIRLNEDEIENSYEIDFQTISDFVGGTSPAKYERYTLPGGEDYKELIFTLSKGGQNVGDNFPLQQGATKKQTTDNLGLDTSAHFNIKGEFAHVRFKERDIAGQKTLTVEELQSDIFQTVKQENKRTLSNAKARVLQLSENSKTSENLQSIEKTYLDDNLIKDFPFKNSWYELATRRLIRYAADNNFEAIAIPEGRVAAARYGKVGGFADNIEISVFKRDNSFNDIPNNYQFTVTYNKGNKEIQKRVLVGEEIKNLEEEFPKSFKDFSGDLNDVLLNKYTQDELIENPFNYKLSEKQFIGEGKGKFELYDQAIPAYIKKYAKKWNAPVTTEELKFRNDQNETVNYIVLKITPEMKRSVQDKSQPLFNVVLPALTGAGGAKAVSDSMRNNTISEPTKNQ